MRTQINMVLRPLGTTVGRVAQVREDLVRGKDVVADNDLSMFHGRRVNLDDLARLDYREVVLAVKGRRHVVELMELLERRAIILEAAGRN